MHILGLLRTFRRNKSSKNIPKGRKWTVFISCINGGITSEILDLRFWSILQQRNVALGNPQYCAIRLACTHACAYI